MSFNWGRTGGDARAYVGSLGSKLVAGSGSSHAERRLKALTATELLRVVNTPVFTGNSSSRAEAVLVFQPAMTTPAGFVWAQVRRLEDLAKIHWRRIPPALRALPTYPLVRRECMFVQVGWRFFQFRCPQNVILLRFA